MIDTTNRNKTLFKVGTSICVVVVSLFLLQNTAFACTPPPITPWFTEYLSFLKTDLPSTINFSVDENQSLNFVNTTGDVFYYENNGETINLGNEMIFDIKIYEDFDLISVNGHSFQDFEHLNKIGDNRPRDVVPPNPQDIVVPILLAQKQYTIQLRVTYEIDDEYISNSVEINKGACSNYFPVPWIPSLSIVAGSCIFLLVLLLGLTIFKRVRLK